MRTATYVIIAVVFLAAIGAVIWFISGSSRSGFDIYTCEEDPYRRVSFNPTRNALPRTKRL
ncbi:MAG: hypothetical protein U5N86_04695 [Planctomycetota bacterium]|nr:hypothetical protein [Planctomycetota bacterium]